MFHVGHLRILERARDLGVSLTVGISSDELNFKKKGRNPIYPFKDRARIISGLKCVDSIFMEESLELKRQYVSQFKSDVLVMGDDWKGGFDFLSDICKVVYLERTPSISTTEIIETIRSVEVPDDK